MVCLQYYDLRDEILTAKPSKVEEPTESQIEKTVALYKVNEPQAKAIISSVSSTGFTLIQGYGYRHLLVKPLLIPVLQSAWNG